jgi:hypothetical protein
MFEAVISTAFQLELNRPLAVCCRPIEEALRHGVATWAFRTQNWHDGHDVQVLSGFELWLLRVMAADASGRKRRFDSVHGSGDVNSKMTDFYRGLLFVMI